MVQITEPLHPLLPLVQPVVRPCTLYMTPTLFSTESWWPRKPQTLASYRHNFPLATWKTGKYRTTQPTARSASNQVDPTNNHDSAWPSRSVTVDSVHEGRPYFPSRGETFQNVEGDQTPIVPGSSNHRMGVIRHDHGNVGLPVDIIF